MINIYLAADVAMENTPLRMISLELPGFVYNGLAFARSFHQQVIAEEGLANARVTNDTDSRRIWAVSKLLENFFLEANIVGADKQGGAVALLAQNEDVGSQLDHILCRKGISMKAFRCLLESREMLIIS